MTWWAWPKTETLILIEKLFCYKLNLLICHQSQYSDTKLKKYIDIYKCEQGLNILLGHFLP